MRRIWDLARKDLLETRRDRLEFLFIFVMPVAFTAFFGLMFGGGSDKLPLAVSDRDGGPQAKALVADLGRSDAVRIVAKNPGEFEQWMADGRSAAGLLIPAGFSKAVEQGRPAQLTVVGDPTSSGAQAVAAEIRSAAGRIVAAQAAARVALEALAQSGGNVSSPSASIRQQAAAIATKSMAQPAVTVKKVEAGAAAGQVPSGFVLSSPGMMVNFIMFSLMTAGIALIMERRNGTLQRLMTTRVRRWELIAGKMAGMFALTFLQQVLLIAVGQLVFGVDYLRDPAALLLMMVSLSLVASSLGLLLASLLTSEQALIAAVVIVSMSVSALSGAWFPLEVAGAGFRAVGHVLPTAWVLDGLRGIIVRGFDVHDVLPAFGVAVAWSAALFGLAVSRFRLS